MDLGWLEYPAQKTNDGQFWQSQAKYSWYGVDVEPQDCSRLFGVCEGVPVCPGRRVYDPVDGERGR